jgi:lambda repressor-like predicted transcriptional regulator
MRNGKRRRGNEQQTYNRSLHVLARMRRTGASLTAAAREEHIDPRTVRKYLKAELRGRGKATKADRRKREMLVPTSLGNSPVTVRGSRQASQLGRYMSAVSKYLRTGDVDGLAEFEGKSIGGHALITDPDILSSLAQAGALTLDEIYAVPEASS